MASVVFRRAQPPDYAAILRLQSANFIANLSEEERKEGFLSAEFAPGQVAKMTEDLGTTLAIFNGEVLGGFCALSVTNSITDLLSSPRCSILTIWSHSTVNQLNLIGVTSTARSAS